MEATKKPAISLSTGTLSASLCAYIMCMSTSAAYANPDRAAMQSNDLNARETWRAARMEARDLSRELRHERRDTPRPVMTPAFRVLPPVAAPRVSRLDGGRNHSDRSDVFKNSRDGNTGSEHMLFPGQVSSFRTTRPHDNRAASLSVGNTFINENGRQRDLSRGLSLDFSSTDANINVGSNLLSGETTIDVGGEAKSISAGSRVTAAEYAALNQKLATGSQGLVLNSDGAASGGSLNLNLVNDDGSTIRASQLVVPKNITVTGDFARSADGVRVTKDVVNYGSIVATSSDANHNTAVIAARNIDNEQGATIASQSSASNPALNLALRADRAISNDGMITSAGSLELSAPEINNHGLVTAGADVTLTASTDSTLAVNNFGGTVSSSGAINIRETGYSGTFNSTVFGGNFLSQELNLNAGQASADLTANQVTGTVNSSGLAAHVSTSTDTLVLGSQCLTGDPTYFNTGNIIIGGDIIVGEALAIISGANITTNQTSLTIQARDLSNQGYDIHIISGAAIQSGSGEVTPAGGPATLPTQSIGSITENAVTAVTIGSGSGGGGKIDLTFATTSLVIDASSTAPGLNGGNVTLAAFTNGANFGQIILNANSQIHASGSGTGNNGNVNIIAGSIVTPAISMGSIDANNGTGTAPNTGVVAIANAQPTSSDGNPITFSTTGNIISGNSIVASTAIGGGVIFTAPIQARVVNINGNGIHVDNNITAESITITGDALIELNGTLTARDSIVVVTANSISTNSSVTFDTSSTTGNGGNVVLVAGASYLQDASTITILGPSLVGSGINFNTLGAINTSSSNPGSAGGDVTAMAFSTGGAGLIDWIVNTGITTSGNGSGASGDVVILGNTIQVSLGANIITNGGAPGSGSVTVLSSHPNSGTAGPIFKNSGSYAGTFADQGILLSGQIAMLSVSTNADVTVVTNGNLFLGNIQSSVGAVDNDGGDVFLSSGPGGSYFSGFINTSGAGTGSGGEINVFAGTGGFLGIGNLTADGGNTGIGGNGGNVFITANRATSFSLPATVNARGLGTSGNGGSLHLANVGSGGLNITPGAFDISGPGSGGTLEYFSTGVITSSGPVTRSILAGGGAFSNGNIVIQGESVNINGLFLLISTGGNDGTGGVFITTTGGGIDTNNTGFIIDTGGDIFIDTAGNDIVSSFATFDSNSNIDAANASFNTPNQGGYTMIANGSISLGSLNVDGTGAAGIVSITSGNGGNSGSITVNSISAIAGGVGGGSLGLTATDGDIDIQTIAISGPLNIALLGTTGGAATLTGNNLVGGLFRASGTGSVDFNNGANPLTTDDIVGTLDVTLSTTDTTTGIQTNDFISILGTLTLNTPKFTNPNSVTANTIVVQNLAGNLTIDGGAGGTMTATVPGNGPPGQPNAAALTIRSANGANLLLNGVMNFGAGGDVLMDNLNGTTTSSNLSLFAAANNITLSTLNWVQVGSGNITANNLIFAGKTIANTDGDVTIGSNISIARDLAIIASGDVILGSSSITLSGHDLTIIAGFDFDVSTVTQIETQNPFTITGPSIAGGSVTGTATIDTSASSGDGGSVKVYASGGTVSFGSIDTSTAGSDGGDIQIYASNGIAIGSIVTTGNSIATDSSGDVDLKVADPLPVNPVTIAAGVLSGNFDFSQTNGALTVGAINAGNGSIQLINSGAEMTIGGNVICTSLDIVTNDNLNLGAVSAITATPHLPGSTAVIAVTAGSMNTFAPTAFTALSDVNPGTVDLVIDDGDFIIGTSNDFSINVSGPTTGGSVSVNTAGNLTVESGGINAAGLNGDGASITLSTDFGQRLTLNNTSFLSAAEATGTNGNGGKIELIAGLMTFTSSSTSPLELNVSQNGTGSGGTVVFANLDPASTVIGVPTKLPKAPVNFLSIFAGNGSPVDPSTVTVAVGGNLTVDPAALLLTLNGPNVAGADVTLIAGNVTGKAGNLVVLGDLNVAGSGAGTDGTAVLSAANKKAFSVGASKAPKNGVFGQVIAGSGQVDISNTTGGVLISASNALLATDITLRAGAKGTIATGTGVTITASGSMLLESALGAIGKKPLVINTPLLEVDTGGGSVNVTDISAGNVDFEANMNGGDLKFSTANSLRIPVSATTADGSITLTAGGGTLNIESGALVQATNGSITISNSDTAAGDILIEDFAQVLTNGDGGNVVIAIGEPPKKGINPAPPVPTGIVPDIQGSKANIFYGPANGIDVPTGIANVNAKNAVVIFNNGSSDVNANKIILGDNVLIEADPPSIMPAAKLDVALLTPIMMEVVSSTPVILGTSNLPTFTLDGINNVNLTNASVASINGVIPENKVGFAQSENATNELIVNAAYFSDRDADQDEFAVENVGSVKLSRSESAEVNNKYALERGNVVFAPFTDKTIETMHGTVKLKAGAVAVITQSADGLSVYDLHDCRKNSVVIEVNNKSLSLSPGKHVTICSGTARDYASVNPIELVQHRSLTRTKLDNGWSVYTSEFSIPSACYAVKPLENMMKSKHPEAAALAKRVLKTSAVLMTLKPDLGDFVQHFKSQVTAMSR